MKILLLGGTGAMGAYLARILSERGKEVYVTTRADRENQVIGMRYIKGDARDANFIAEVLKNGYDVIVDFMIYNTAEFRQRADLMLASCAQYIFLSSARVYANSSGPLTEKSPRLLDVCDDADYLATDEYALTKARQENTLFSAKRDNWTIVRPYITYAGSRLQLGTMEKERWLFRAINGKSVIFPADVAERETTMTDGGDAAQAIRALIGNGDALGKAVHIAGADSVKWKDVLQIYLEALEPLLGKRPRVKTLENSEPLIKILRNEYQTRYDRLYDRVFDNSLARELCGPINYTQAKVGLKNRLNEFFKGERVFKDVSWRFEGWADRICGEVDPLKNVRGLKNKSKYALARLGVI